ncbi:hypothetical protein DFH27DRAFT_623168 [Peziza echinospora]|nr:hypothetical protein DFH27DRAFT_623168 [Peziza echinospora]
MAGEIRPISRECRRSSMLMRSCLISPTNELALSVISRPIDCLLCSCEAYSLPGGEARSRLSLSVRPHPPTQANPCRQLVDEYSRPQTPDPGLVPLPLCDPRSIIHPALPRLCLLPPPSPLLSLCLLHPYPAPPLPLSLALRLLLRLLGHAHSSVLPLLPRLAHLDLQQLPPHVCRLSLFAWLAVSRARTHLYRQLQSQAPAPPLVFSQQPIHPARSRPKPIQPTGHFTCLSYLPTPHHTHTHTHTHTHPSYLRAALVALLSVSFTHPTHPHHPPRTLATATC